MGKLDGKVALTSGGARGQGAAEAKRVAAAGGEEGEGAAEAKRFAEEGAKVVFGDVRDSEGKTVEEAIRGAGGVASYVHLDVASEADWQHAVQTATTRYGRLDILINNAAIVIPRVP